MTPEFEKRLEEAAHNYVRSQIEGADDYVIRKDIEMFKEYFKAGYQQGIRDAVEKLRQADEYNLALMIERELLGGEEE